MSWLQILWFFLLFVLFSGFFVLEGFDFGVGMSTSYWRVTLTKKINSLPQSAHIGMETKFG